ncbi:hypothetical protein L873DRAFT_1845502 [Choiromyces venosus 120613-1]|uniref:Uncharacterized protein n=1 Tax=Choiromyces venosus 120613-1 TaxID=1336337 RepID=A0A3N4JCZ1_9PEZI|nr:hypothetical protein L873DRAFT_1845502 [Choiromyces venosus 120613-1]
MANELDPHHLVALMNCEFQNKQDHASHHLGSTSYSLKYGVRYDHDTNIRSFPILDAIASISVSQESSKGVAIALQLNSQKQEIHLTIAENQEVKDSLINHLTNIWAKLKALSDEYAKQRVGRPDKHEGKSPEMSMDMALPLEVEIFRDIHLYSLEKQMKRVKRWKDDLCIFMTHLLERRGSVDLQGIELNLYNIVVGLILTLKLIYRLYDNPQNELTHQEWEMIYSNSLCIGENMTLVLVDRNWSGCENLAWELKDYRPDGPFKLRHALEKLTSLNRHIESLFAFAHSPRLRRALQYRMSISVVPEQTCTIKFPTLQKQWQSILETTCIEHTDWQWEEAGKLLRRFPLEEYTCPVHCECGLIQYLQAKQDTPWGNVPPFRYIGVSKLSCSACRIWIEAFNGLGRQQFYTRGSHRKWYWPWGMPTVEESLGKIMTGKISGEYIAHQEELGHLRSGSCSSDTSSLQGAQSRSSTAQKELFTSRIAEAELEYGGSRLDLMRATYQEHQK